MNANLIQNEWPEEYGIDLNPALALSSLWQSPLLTTLIQVLIAGVVLILAAAEAYALGSGHSMMLGTSWWEGLFDSYTAGAYDAGGATIVAL